MTAWLSIALFSALAGRPAAPSLKPLLRRPRAMAVIRLAPSTFTLNVSPATITFSATNPDSVPSVSGSSPAWLTWYYPGGTKNGAWTLTVQSTSAAFATCGEIPASAVTVSCAAASADGGGSATCNPPFTLSTTAATVASGRVGVKTANFSVSINFTLADNWKSIAQTSPSCSLSLSYAATVP